MALSSATLNSKRSRIFSTEMGVMPVLEIFADRILFEICQSIGSPKEKQNQNAISKKDNVRPLYNACSTNHRKVLLQ